MIKQVFPGASDVEKHCDRTVPSSSMSARMLSARPSPSPPRARAHSRPPCSRTPCTSSARASNVCRTATGPTKCAGSFFYGTSRSG